MDLTIFDVDELLHLAIKLTSQERHGDALACLKRAAKLDPRSGTVVYLIAAVYAQLDMYDRSLSTMERAVQLDPGLSTAHFQIGLMYFTSNRLAQAIEAWKSLENLSEDEPLFLFKTGLEALAREDFDACRKYLSEGVARNVMNPMLNADIERILRGVGNRETQ